jgi:hypothetical protein
MIFDDHKLQNGVRIQQLKIEAFEQKEFDGLVNSAKKRLIDSQTPKLSFDSRFDLAYNAAHALALAALRYRGYRSDKRYYVFQTLIYVLDVTPAQVKIFTECHSRRNTAEYEGYMQEDEAMLAELIMHTKVLLGVVEKLK